MSKLAVKIHADRAAAEARYLAQVDRDADSSAPRVTPMHEAKWQEVQAGVGPILRAEADALGCSLQEVIDSVTAARRRWSEAEAAREAARVAAKARIRAAESAADMHRIAATWRD